MLLRLVALLALLAVAGSIPGGAAANCSLTESPARIVAFVQERLSLLSSLPPLLGAEHGVAAATRPEALRGAWSVLEDLLKAVASALRLLLDPAPLGSFDLHLNNSFIKGRLAARGVLARHLHDARLHVGQLNPLTMCAAVRAELPRLTIHTDYDVDLDLNDGDADGELIPVFGSGLALIGLHAAEMSTDVCLSVTELAVQVVNMKVSLERAEVELQGLFGGGAISDFISEIATDVLPGGLKEYEPEITQAVMEYVNAFIRRILQGSPKRFANAELMNENIYS